MSNTSAQGSPSSFPNQVNPLADLNATFGTPSSTPSASSVTASQLGSHDPGIRAMSEAMPMSDEGRQMQIAATIQAMFSKFKEARRPLIPQWKKNYQILNNRVWTTRAEPWMPAPEVSNIWPLIASFVAWCTDQRPGCEVVAAMPPFSAFADHFDKMAEDMNSVLDSQFAENEEDAEIEKVLWDVCTYQIGIMKTTWEPWLADGMGDATMRRVDPFTWYPDPHARNIREANAFIEAKVMTLDALDRAWPGAAGRVYPGLSDTPEVAPHVLDNQVMPGAPRVNIGPIAPNTSFSTYQQSARANLPLVSEDPTVLVLEAWIRTHTTVTHKDDPTIMEGTARVIDRWKCIVVCNNTVLMDKYADEIYAFSTHPYDRMPLFDTGEMYGPCLVEFLTSPQESINRMLQTIEMNLLLLGNPILMQEPRANVGGRATITNRPGQRINGKAGDTGWLQPPEIHPDFMRLIEYYEGKLETISGLSAIMRGFQQQGRNSTDVMSSVQDSAFVRVRATLRNLERLLRGACKKKCALVAEFYTEPRLINQLGQDDGEPTAKALRARHFYNLPDDEDPSTPTLPLRFNLRADAGSDHPTSRQARQAQAERLYAMGAIDDIEILKAERWPNWPTVAGRVMDMKAQAGMLGQPPNKRQATRSQ